MSRVKKGLVAKSVARCEIRRCLSDVSDLRCELVVMAQLQALIFLRIMIFFLYVEQLSGSYSFSKLSNCGFFQSYAVASIG